MLNGLEVILRLLTSRTPDERAAQLGKIVAMLETGHSLT